MIKTKVTNALRIVEFTNDQQQQVKSLVIGVHNEFGFPYDFKLDYDLEDPMKHYTNMGGIVYVLLDKKTVVGSIAVKKADEKTAEIKRMYLLHKYRGRGWGARLLERALLFCRAKGFRSCILDTNVKQEAAQRLYANYGFKAYKREKNDLFMRLNLT